MKKVYSNRLIIRFSIFGILFFSTTIFVCAFSLINSVINEQSNMIMLYSILIAEFACFVFLLFLMLNRFGYKIIYNEDERTITRKVFICGYKYIIKIEDINDIVIETFPKETEFNFKKIYSQPIEVYVKIYQDISYNEFKEEFENMDYTAYLNSFSNIDIYGKNSKLRKIKICSEETA